MIENENKTVDVAKRISHSITLFMCGDVMTGRGIDQILPHPSKPVIYESYMKSARGYVDIAEQTNGPIDYPVSFSYIWGDALEELDKLAPDVRIINLETSVTKNNDYWKGKGINYRMHPDNISSLSAAKIDVCCLANNHVLDWGYAGLVETLESLDSANIKTAGAGLNRVQAQVPAMKSVPGKGRALVFAYGLGTSGIPSSWGAADSRPGVNLLEDLSDKSLDAIKEKIQQIKRKGDIVVASIHWGGNWGYDIPQGQTGFAHRLIDEAGIDIVHGHSSHHVKGIEVYRQKLILYGCGDFLNDYEGIGGHEAFRADLSLMYFAALDPLTGKLVELKLVPTQIRQFKIHRASKVDTLWLKDTLNREGAKFGTWVKLSEDNHLILHWQ
ncbi:MAG: CapA family protein [Desulfobacterales bacterium]|jgi:poly-gamma-glutamate synthesis protein (capsule biosynthesis protein)